MPPASVKNGSRNTPSQELRSRPGGRVRASARSTFIFREQAMVGNQVVCLKVPESSLQQLRKVAGACGRGSTFLAPWPLGWGSPSREGGRAAWDAPLSTAV